MKTLSVLFSMLFLVFVSTSCNAQKEVSNTVAKDVSVKEFSELVAKGEGQLIDVRTPSEYSNGHLEKATLVDFNGADFDKQLEGLDKSKPVYVYCAAGGRSAKAMAKMKANGFKEVYNLVGGFGAWQSEGMKVEK